MIKSRAMLLAGVSALAMLACVAEADAETFPFTGGEQSFPVLVSGEYSLDVFGASGGPSENEAGGLGAEVSGDIVLTAGETLTLFVGGQGQNGHGGGGGGGGGAFVFLGTSVLAVAGGGGGASYVGGGGPGQAGTAGGAGGGPDGGAGGASGSGGRGGPIFTASILAGTAAAARASPQAPPGTGATALAVLRDSARNFPMAAPVPSSTAAAAASAAAAAAATTAAAAAGAGSPAAAAAPATSASVAAAAAPIWRSCSPARS